MAGNETGTGNETGNICKAPGEPRSRKRLRPLIISLLDAGHLRGQGLVWRDRRAMVWQLPWKNKKRSLEGDPDAVVIREIAKVMWPHEAALSRWKELLRNALRSLKDITLLEEDKEKTYKVYQFLEEAIKGKKGLKTDVKEPMFDANIYKGIIAQAFSGDDALFAEKLEDCFDNDDIDNSNESITDNFRSRSPLQQSQSSDDSGITSSFAYTPKSESQDGFSSSQESVVQFQPTVNKAGLPFSNLPNISNLLGSDNASNLNQMSSNNTSLIPKVQTLDFNTLQNTEPSLLTHISHKINELVSATDNPNQGYLDPTTQLSQDPLFNGFDADLGNIQPGLLDCNSVKFETATTILGASAEHCPVVSSTHECGGQGLGLGRPLALVEVNYHTCPVLKYSITQPQFSLSFSDFCEKGENIRLPNPNNIKQLVGGQKDYIYNFLTSLFKRGIFFHFKGDDLFVTRKCKGGVVSQIIPDIPKGERLVRHQETKIFSYEGFMNDLQKYKESNGGSCPPPDHVKLLICVSSSTHTMVPGRPGIISCTLHHCRAARGLRDTHDDMFPTEAPVGSRSDSYDKVMASLENMTL